MADDMYRLALARSGYSEGVPRFPFETAAVFAGDMDGPDGPVLAPKVYLAGPMTGYPEFNFPEFHRVTAILRAWGFEVESPAERDEADGFDPKNHAAQSHSYYMAIDLPMVCNADAVVVLDGWEASSGARMETAIAHALGKPVVHYSTLAQVEAPEIAFPSQWQPTQVVGPSEDVVEHVEALAKTEDAAGGGPMACCGDPGDCAGPCPVGPVTAEAIDAAVDLGGYVRGQVAEQVLAEGLKPTNPKDAIGSDKLPLHLWPQTATVYGCLGMLDGALKYGRSNFRAIGVRTMIYLDAVERHLKAYAEGEDLDPDSGLPHLSHALAGLAILVDALAAGNATDDRNYPGGYRATVEALTPHVARLKAKHSAKSPKHYSIADADES